MTRQALKTMVLAVIEIGFTAIALILLIPPIKSDLNEPNHYLTGAVLFTFFFALGQVAAIMHRGSESRIAVARLILVLCFGFVTYLICDFA